MLIEFFWWFDLLQVMYFIASARLLLYNISTHNAYCVTTTVMTKMLLDIVT